MNSPRLYFLTTMGCLILAVTAAASSDLNTPDQRRESVNQALALIHPSSPALLPADLKNPFVLSRNADQEQVAKPINNDREALAGIAPQVVPSGVVQMGDTPILLLGEKKLKVGDYFTFPFEGTDYVVEVAAISHSTFTLRLNKEEITQPINP
jgi:hypothetical protein